MTVSKSSSSSSSQEICPNFNSENSPSSSSTADSPTLANTKNVAFNILNLPPDLLTIIFHLKTDPPITHACQDWHKTTLESILNETFKILGKSRKLFVEERLSNNKYLSDICSLKQKVYALLLDQQMTLGIIQPRGNKFDLVLEDLHDHKHFPNISYLKEKMHTFLLNELRSVLTPGEKEPDLDELYQWYSEGDREEGMFDLRELYGSIKPQNLPAHFDSFICSENFLRDSALCNICAAQHIVKEYIKDGIRLFENINILTECFPADPPTCISTQAAQLREWLKTESAQQIVAIEAEGFKIGEVPKEICTLPRLKSLKLDGNSISQISEICLISNLSSLCLCKNAIDRLPASFSKLEKLEHLDLSDNQIELFPEVLTNLSCLKRLQLNGNRIQELPSSFREWKNLNHLDLSDNNIKQVPEVLKQLPKLDFLKLDNNGLTNIPSWLFEIPTLKSLNLAQNSLSTLPDLSNAINLETLNISNNAFIRFPEKIFNLPKLKWLDISLNDFTIPRKELYEKFPKLVLTTSRQDSSESENEDTLGFNSVSFPSASSSRSSNSLSIESEERASDSDSSSSSQTSVKRISSQPHEDDPPAKRRKRNQDSDKKPSSSSDVEMTTPEVFQKDHEQEIENGKLPEDTLKQIFSLNLRAQFRPVCKSWKEAADATDLQTYCQIAALEPEKLLQLEEYLKIKDQTPREKIHKLLEDQQQRFAWLTSHYRVIPKLHLFSLADSAVNFVNIEKWINDFSLIQMCFSFFEIAELHSKAKALFAKISAYGFYDLTEDVADLRTSFNQNVAHVQVLNLRDHPHQMTEIPEEIGELTNLILLTIPHHHIRVLPETLSQLSNLKHLTITNNDLKEIPEWLFQMNLKTLCLGGNQIQFLPDNIPKAIPLRNFDISFNKIERLPPKLFELPLKILNIAGNPLEKIPPEIFSMTKLKELWISDEQQKLLPPNPNTNVHIDIIYRKSRDDNMCNPSQLVVVDDGSSED